MNSGGATPSVNPSRGPRFWASAAALTVFGLTPPVQVGAVDATCAGRQATIVGTDDHDVLVGTTGDDVIVGGDGGDRIDGLEGNDTICSGEGYDKVLGGPGNDWLEDTGTADNPPPPGASGGRAPGDANGGPGDDVISGYQSADGNEGNDLVMAGPTQITVGLYGGPGDDTLIGSDQIDLWGGHYGDRLRGGDGNDLLYGGDYNDQFWPGLGNDTVFGGEGTDWILFTDVLGPLLVDLSAGTARSAAGVDGLGGIEVVFGSAFSDHLVGSAGYDVLIGCGGNDLIFGLGGSDALFGKGDRGGILSFDCHSSLDELNVLVGGEGYDLCAMPDIRLECEDPCDDVYYCEPGRSGAPPIARVSP